MRAVVHTRYGGPEVQRVVDVDRPTPSDDEVLVKVAATTVNRTDTAFRQAKPFVNRLAGGIRRPRHAILGSEFAGEVAAVGRDVTEFEVGDHVFGVNSYKFGAHAEFVCVREDAPIAHRPAGTTFDEAAAMPDGFVLARTIVKWSGVAEGQRVLVYGASGSIGTAAVQLAKHRGAHVTAVCDGRYIDAVRSLGADRLIDYAAEDFTAQDETYDVIIDAVAKTSYPQCRKLLVRGGTFASTEFGRLFHVPLLALATFVTGRFGTRRVQLPLPQYSKQHMLRLKELVETGAYRAVIDRRYPLEQVVEASTYVDTGQKLGNVVVTVDHAAAAAPSS